jgi:MacB-like periplasmic core domain
MTNFWNDVRHGVRILLHSPGFSLVAVAALAIGIGANTTIFSVINTLLIQRLPYRDADRLAIVWEHNIPRDRKSNVVSPANFLHWRDMNQTFEGLAALSPTINVTLTGNGDPEEVQAQVITAELFQARGTAGTDNERGSSPDSFSRSMRCPLLRRPVRSAGCRSLASVQQRQCRSSVSLNRPRGWSR